MLRPYADAGMPVGRDLSPRLAPPGEPRHLLDQLVVAEAGGARRLGEAGVHRRVGDDARQRVELQDVGDAEPIDADVHAAPVAAAEGLVRLERGALDLAA